MARTLALVCDTNIWYDAVVDYKLFRRITRFGGTPCLAFSSFLEIVGGMTESNYERRRDACKTIVSVGPKVLPDSETFVSVSSGQWSAERNWSPLLYDMATSHSFQQASQLQSFAVLKGHRETMERERLGDFVRGVPLVANDLGLDGKKYQAAIAGKGNMPRWHLPRQAFDSYWSRHGLAAFDQAFQTRFGATVEKSKLECYIAVYKEYFYALLSKPMKPKKNDCCDLEQFMYLIDDWHILVTRDQKWVDYAMDSGWSRRVMVA